MAYPAKVTHIQNRRRWIENELKSEPELDDEGYKIIKEEDDDEEFEGEEENKEPPGEDEEYVPEELLVI